MFKKQKITERRAKKDFFAKKKKSKLGEIEMRHSGEINKTRFFIVDKLDKVPLPEDEIFFITTLKNSAITEILIGHDVDECFLFCASLKKSEIVDRPITHILYRESTIKKIIDKYEDIITDKGIITKPANPHNKAVAFRMGDDYYVLNGSGNAGNNARNENYYFIRSEEFYNKIKKYFIDV